MQDPCLHLCCSLMNRSSPARPFTFLDTPSVRLRDKMSHVSKKGLLHGTADRENIFWCGSLEVTGFSKGHISWPQLSNVVTSHRVTSIATSSFLSGKNKVSGQGVVWDTTEQTHDTEAQQKESMRRKSN